MEETLTNEGLRKLFRDGFELAHFAIRVGRKRVGHEDISLKSILHWVTTHPSEQALDEFGHEEDEEIDHEG